MRCAEEKRSLSPENSQYTLHVHVHLSLQLTSENLHTYFEVISILKFFVLLKIIHKRLIIFIRISNKYGRMHEVGGYGFMIIMMGIAPNQL